MSYRVFFKELPDKLSGVLLLAEGGVERHRPLSQKRILANPATGAPPQGGGTRDSAPQRAPQPPGKKPVTPKTQENTGPGPRPVAEKYVEDPRRPMTIRDVHQGWGRRA